ncbi:Amidohydrolase family [Leishmania braziliensis]|nr:Amidohydrolase family [Leishmania braziliensis]
MTSVLAIVNAQRVWRGASALKPTVASSYPPEVDALLVEGGLISFIGSTEEVLQRYGELVAMQPADAAAASPQPVEGGRPRAVSHNVIDCEHRHAVYPGFIDSHVHFLDGGRMLLAPQLGFATSRTQFLAIVRDFVEHRYNREEGGWVYGFGWSEAVLGCSPTREWLDEVSTEIHLVMYSKDMHSAVMNTAALRSCHIIPGADDGEPLITSVEGGVIELNENGLPNGVLRDNVIQLTKRYAPAADTPTNQRRALEASTEHLLSLGFTSVFSMMSTTYMDNLNEINFLAQMEHGGAMRLRVRYGVPPSDVEPFMEKFYSAMAADAAQSGRSDAFMLPYRFTMTPPAAGGGYLLLGAVKLFADGSLSSRTAAMNRPYGYNVMTEGDISSDLDDAEISAILAERSGGQCQCGLLTMPRLELQGAIRLAHSHDLQCVVHAIGDRAVATVNRALCASADWLREREAEPGVVAAVARFRADPRSRVEHCQHMSNVAKEVRRMAHYGIIASMQPCHLLFDGDYVDELLGQRRKDTAYMWGTLLAANIRVDLGSDWPVAPADVNDGLRGAVTRVPDVMMALAAEEAQHQSKQQAQQSADSTAAGAVTALRRYHDTWNPTECISMDTALRTYTYEGAHGMFMEDYLGTLEVGKYADITVWTADWLDDTGMKQMVGVEGTNARWWPRHQEPRVAYTVVGGIVEYRSH